MWWQKSKQQISKPLSLRHKGHFYEGKALQYLQQRGLRLVAQNYTARCGEIDLILKDGDTIVFVEVRFRRHASHGGAVASVDFRKQKKLIKTAQHYLQRYALDTAPCRFDVLGIDVVGDGLEFQWVRDVVLF